MIPVRLQVRGFLSYYDPVDVDFNGIDLACISGSNGAGKSSLLDAFTWALFGEARRRDDTVINQRTQTENKSAEVILDFDYEGAAYRVQRSKQKDKTAVLDFYLRDADGTWKPLTEATLRATEERIRHTLRLDYETFINASFFLQGKADQFAQQKPADRKRILASILGLEIWEQYKEEAARRRRDAELELAACDAELDGFQSELEEEDQRKADLERLQKEHDTRNALAAANRQILDQQRLISAQYQSEQNRLQAQSVEIKRLQAAIDQKVDTLHSRRNEQKKFRTQLANENVIATGHAQWLDLQKELSTMDEVATSYHQLELQRQAPLLQIEREKASLEAALKTLSEREHEIKSLASVLPDLQQQLTESEERIRAGESQLVLRPTLEQDLQDLQSERARAKAENTVLKSEMDDLETRRKALRETHESACPTCEKPLAEDEKQRIIDDLTARGTAKAETYRRNTKVIEQCEADQREKESALASLQRVETELKQHQRKLDAQNGELQRMSETLEKWKNEENPRMENLRALLTAAFYGGEARTQLAAIEKEMLALQYDAAAHAELKSAEVAARTFQQQKNDLDQAKSALAPLEREISALETEVKISEDRLKALDAAFKADAQHFDEHFASLPDLAEMERSQRALQEEVNTLLTQVGYARSRVDVLEQVRKQKTTKEQDKKQILTYIVRLKTVEKSFGKDGIPALLIEQALPEIEEHANEILDRLSDGLMHLTFATQREYKDAKREDRKETLDILISSSAEERAYELFSGGEAFRINFAVRLALSRMLAHRAGARLQTLVIDEGFGSQDAEGRQRLIEAINYVRGEFARIIVITHLEELKDAFSARIEVSKTPGGSQVRVVAA